MIYWQKTFNGLEGYGHYRGWEIVIENKILSRTKFKVKYILNCSTIMMAFISDPNKIKIEESLRKILNGREFVEETEINNYLKWPKTLYDNLVTNEATTHAVAHLNYALGDAITYLKKKGIAI